MRALPGCGVIVTIAVLLLGATACSSPFPLVPASAPETSRTREALEAADYMVHLTALQEIANANDGTRAAGTTGYEESAEYVEAILREAGYAPVRQVFTYRDGGSGALVESFNVLADTAGSPDHTIVVGGPLDSVRNGPGINDNGSGIAAMLEVARWFPKSAPEPRNRVRFAFWGAEEDGLEGSDHHVTQLTAGKTERTALDLNIDMAGSPNGARFVHDGDGSVFGGDHPDGSAQIEEVFLDNFAASGLSADATVFDGGSDYEAFREAGIPVGGLFSGDVGIKSVVEADSYGGTVGEAHDPCYHERCDTTDNVDLVLLAQMTAALGHATQTFANAPPR